MTLVAGHILYGPQFASLDTGRQEFHLLESWSPFRLALLFCLENVGHIIRTDNSLCLVTLREACARFTSHSLQNRLPVESS